MSYLSIADLPHAQCTVRNDAVYAGIKHGTTNKRAFDIRPGAPGRAGPAVCFLQIRLPWKPYFGNTKDVGPRNRASDCGPRGGYSLDIAAAAFGLLAPVLAPGGGPGGGPGRVFFALLQFLARVSINPADMAMQHQRT